MRLQHRQGTRTCEAQSIAERNRKPDSNSNKAKRTSLTTDMDALGSERGGFLVQFTAPAPLRRVVTGDQLESDPLGSGSSGRREQRGCNGTCARAAPYERRCSLAIRRTPSPPLEATAAPIRGR